MYSFDPVYTEGMCALRDAEFFEFHDDLVLLGVSGDGIDSHERPVPPDPRGEPFVRVDAVARHAEQYQVVVELEELGVAQRTYPFCTDRVERVERQQVPALACRPRRRPRVCLESL